MTSPILRNTGYSADDDDSKVYRNMSLAAVGRHIHLYRNKMSQKKQGRQGPGTYDDYDDIDDSISLASLSHIHRPQNPSNKTHPELPHKLHEMMPDDVDKRVNYFGSDQQEREQLSFKSLNSEGLHCIEEKDEYEDQEDTDQESVVSGRTQRFKKFQTLIDTINKSSSTFGDSSITNDHTKEKTNGSQKSDMMTLPILGKPESSSVPKDSNIKDLGIETDASSHMSPSSHFTINSDNDSSDHSSNHENDRQAMHKLESEQSSKSLSLSFTGSLRCIDENDSCSFEDDNEPDFATTGRGQLLLNSQRALGLSSSQMSPGSQRSFRLTRSFSISNNNHEIDSSQNGLSEEDKVRLNPSCSRSNSLSTRSSSIRFSDDDETKNDSELNIDEDIVTNILRDSQQRSVRLQKELNRNRWCNIKCWKRTLIGIIVVFGIVASTIVTFTLVGYFDAEEGDGSKEEFDNHGIVDSYNDHSDYHDHHDYEHDLDFILDTPIQVDDRMIPIEMIQHLVDRDQKLEKNDENIYYEIPFFWKVPHSGSVIENILAECFNLVLASDLIDEVIPELLQSSNELLIFNVDNTRYVNVDLSDREGIKKAGQLGLASSGLADVISSKYVNYATSHLFDGHFQKGRLFTLLRHPVDQAIVSYYHFLSNRKSSELTLQQYISSPYMKENWLTHFLSTVNDLEDSVNLDSLGFAKEILRRKCVVGIYEDLAESLELFVNYYEWNVDTAEQYQCVNKSIDESNNVTHSIYRKITNQRYHIEYGSEIYKAIIAKNELDMELYWYAFDLHKAQLARINSRSS